MEETDHVIQKMTRCTGCDNFGPNFHQFTNLINFEPLSLPGNPGAFISGNF